MLIEPRDFDLGQRFEAPYRTVRLFNGTVARDALTLGSGLRPGFGRRHVFSGPFPSKLLEFSRAIQAQLVLNFFAVRLDGLTAQVKLFRDLPRAVRSAQKLKYLHLAIRQGFDADSRGGSAADGNGRKG